MATILHISCSSRGEASESHRLSRKLIALLAKSESSTVLIDRPIGAGAISHIDSNDAHAQHSAEAEVSRAGTISRSEELIRELERADTVVIATPMHNFTVPSVLKAWIDHVVRARRTFRSAPEGKVGMLRDRPVFVAVASGGRFAGARARQPDFLTPYLKAALNTIGLQDLTFFSVQGTGLGPEALAAARAQADQALHEFFA